SDTDQRWERFELRARPSGHIRSFTDAFRNPGYLVTLVSPHELIELTTQSEVTTLLTDPFALPPGMARPLDPLERFDYLAPSRLIPRDARLIEMATPYMAAASEDGLGVAQALADLVHSEF